MTLGRPLGQMQMRNQKGNASKCEGIKAMEGGDEAMGPGFSAAESVPSTAYRLIRWRVLDYTGLANIRELQ